MNSAYIIDNFDIQTLKMLSEQTEYSFSCSMEGALSLEKDFIFLPLITFTEVESTLETVFDNPYCKGVVFDRKLMRNQKFRMIYNSLMKKYGSKLEFVALVPNIYNFAYSLVLEISKSFKGEVISAVGTSGTFETVDLLKYSMQGKFQVTSTIESWNCWQKVFEPFFLIEEKTNYVLLEVIPDKVDLTSLASRIRRNNIIFTGFSIFNMNLYENMEILSDELLKILSNQRFVKSVSISENNQLVDYIPSSFSKILNLVNLTDKSRLKLNHKYSYLEPFCELVFSFLEYKDIIPRFFDKYEAKSNLYNICKKEDVDYFVVNPDRANFSSSLTLIKEFCELYDDKQKVIVFEYFRNLGSYKDSVYSEFMKVLADVNPSNLILVNVNSYNHYFRRYNKSAYVQNIKYSTDDLQSIEKLKLFMANLKTFKNSAIYVQLNDNTMALMQEVDSEIFN